MATKKKDVEEVDNVPVVEDTFTLATRWGHTFQPNGKDLPLITPVGVEMDAESATVITDQARKQKVQLKITSKEA